MRTFANPPLTKWLYVLFSIAPGFALILFGLYLFLFLLPGDYWSLVFVGLGLIMGPMNISTAWERIEVDKNTLTIATPFGRRLIPLNTITNIKWSKPNHISGNLLIIEMSDRPYRLAPGTGLNTGIRKEAFEYLNKRKEQDWREIDWPS